MIDSYHIHIYQSQPAVAIHI